MTPCPTCATPDPAHRIDCADLGWDGATIPPDIAATILDMCNAITGGSTSALYGRVHDVRAWVEERR